MGAFLSFSTTMMNRTQSTPIQQQQLRRVCSTLPKKGPVRLKPFPFQRNQQRSWFSRKNLLLGLAALCIVACVNLAARHATHRRLRPRSTVVLRAPKIAPDLRAGSITGRPQKSQNKKIQKVKEIENLRNQRKDHCRVDDNTWRTEDQMNQEDFFLVGEYIVRNAVSDSHRVFYNRENCKNDKTRALFVHRDNNDLIFCEEGWIPGIDTEKYRVTKLNQELKDEKWPRWINPDDCTFRVLTPEIVNGDNVECVSQKVEKEKTKLSGWLEITLDAFQAVGEPKKSFLENLKMSGSKKYKIYLKFAEPTTKKDY